MSLGIVGFTFQYSSVPVVIFLVRSVLMTFELYILLIYLFYMFNASTWPRILVRLELLKT